MLQKFTTQPITKLLDDILLCCMFIIHLCDSNGPEYLRVSTVTGSMKDIWNVHFLTLLNNIGVIPYNYMNMISSAPHFDLLFQRNVKYYI